MTSPESPTTSIHLVFVYGTLMRDQGNHAFLDGQRFMGEATTEGDFYCMTHMGSFPAAFEDSYHEAAREVTGEVWAVDQECFDRLDALEGVGHDFYNRKQMLVRVSPPGQDTTDVVLCWIYLACHWAKKQPPVPGNDWAAYRERARRDFEAARRC